MFFQTALDAMRKAHEAEVQKEISKFKEECLRKVQSSHDIGVLHREHELVLRLLAISPPPLTPLILVCIKMCF